MGVGELACIREELLQHGKDPATPVAFIEHGTTKKERTFIGTLVDIHDLARRVELQNPALIIIGEVVKIQERLTDIERQAISMIG